MLRFMRGWVRITVTGNSPERFLNLCRNRGVVLWDVIAEECGYICSMYWDDYENCGYLADKACVAVTCMAEYGLHVYVKRYRYRQAFLAACCLLLFAIWFSSLHLWGIQIENNLYYSDDQVLSCLKEHGIMVGVRKKKVDCETLEQILRDTFDRISWSAVTVNGTILNINIAENYGTLEAAMADTAPADLIAEMDGVVDSLVVRKGIAQVKVGDTVTKGQVLVSGSVPRHNDALEIAGYEFVHADADVILKTTITYENQIALEKSEKVYMQGRGSVYHIYFAGRDYSVPTPVRLFWNLADEGQGYLGSILQGIQGGEKEDAAESFSENQVDTIGSGYQKLLIPELGIALYGYQEEEKEYEIRHTWIPESLATNILQKKLDRFLENLQKNQEVVVENQVRIYYDSVVCRASGDIVLLRPQAGYQSIDYSAYETETQESENDVQEEE